MTQISSKLNKPWSQNLVTTNYKKRYITRDGPGHSAWGSLCTNGGPSVVRISEMIILSVASDLLYPIPSFHLNALPQKQRSMRINSQESNLQLSKQRQEWRHIAQMPTLHGNLKPGALMVVNQVYFRCTAQSPVYKHSRNCLILVLVGLNANYRSGLFPNPQHKGTSLVYQHDQHSFRTSNSLECRALSIWRCKFFTMTRRNA